MMYIFAFLFFFGALYLGRLPCIHFFDVQTLDIVYMVFGDLWTVFMGFVFMFMCFYGYVHGLCMDCVWICVWLVFGYVYGYVYGHRVLILRKAWFNEYRGLPLLGARFCHCWDLLTHEAHLCRCWDLFLHGAHFDKFWVLLLHEAHLDDSSNFSNFSKKKWKNFAPVCSVE